MKKPYPLLALLTVLLILGGCATRITQASKGTTYQLYFLGGQSNMDGYGYTAELSDDWLDEGRSVRIFVGRGEADNAHGGGVGVWDTLRPGFGTGFASDGVTNTLSDRFGPELAFGAKMAELEPDSKIAIIKYARGGTALAPNAGYGNWDPDSRDGHEPNQYDHALATIRWALTHADIDGDGRVDELVPAGIIWMQGEADANQSQIAADEYGANLKRMMDLLRAALHVDDLPLVIGKITDSGMGQDGPLMPYIETVQEAQAAFVEEDAHAIYVTVTDSLSYSDDAWHYDTEGFLRMGEAFAKAMHAQRN